MHSLIDSLEIAFPKLAKDLETDLPGSLVTIHPDGVEAQILALARIAHTMAMRCCELEERIDSLEEQQ